MSNAVTRSIAILVAVTLFPVETEAQIVNLPSRRLDNGIQEQISYGDIFVWHHYHGGFFSDDADADDVLAVASVSETEKGNGCTVNAFGEAESWCNTDIGNTSFIPEVNTSGGIEVSVHKGTLSAGGRAISEWFSRAAADFEIERHPTIDTEGSENDADVTLEGAFFMLAGEVTTGSLSDFYAGNTTLRVGLSSVDVDYLYGTGWVLNGSLEQSSAADPDALPLPLDDVALGAGVDFLLEFSQATVIGAEIHIETDVQNLMAESMSLSGSATGTHATEADYSLAAWYEVFDVEL